MTMPVPMPSPDPQTRGGNDPYGDDNDGGSSSGWPVKALSTALYLSALALVLMSSSHVATLRHIAPQTDTSPATSTAAPVEPAAPAAPVRAAGLVSVTPQAGEGLIHMTQRVCGTSKTWQAQAAALHLSAPYTIYLGRSYRIDCSAPSGVGTSSKTQPAVPSPAAGWVRPLGGSWCFQPNGSREFGTPRVGHRHGGIDLGSPVGAHNGSPIYAIHSGIAHRGNEPGGAGLYVWIDHGDGTSSWYFHESSRVATERQNVKAGQLIGFVGATGNAAAQYHRGVPQYHLHLETHVGSTKKDPVAFLAARGVHIQC